MGARRGTWAAALLVCAGTTQAADTGFYFGVLAGQAKYDFDTPQLPVIGQVPGDGGIVPVPRDPLDPIDIPDFVVGVALPGVLWLPSDDDTDAAWGISAGYRFGRYVAVELNYLNLGKLEATDPLFPPLPGGGTTTVQRELETTGPEVSVLGILPLSDSWELYLRGGVFFADMEFTTAVGASSFSHTTGSEAAAVGAGVQFNRAEHWSARIEWQRYLDVGEEATFSSTADIDLLSLAILYRL